MALTLFRTEFIACYLNAVFHVLKNTVYLSLFYVI